MEIKFNILIFLLLILIKVTANSIKQTKIDDGGIHYLMIELTLETQQTIELTYYNNKTHYFENFICSNQEKCACESSKFGNFFCHQDNDEFYLTFQKQPYVQGDMIMLKDNMNQKRENSTNHNQALESHLRILDFEQYLNNSLAAQSVTYIDTDLSSSLQLGTYELFMKWEIYTNGTFDMAIDYNQLNWIGFGFCPTMSDCDMIVLYVSNSVVLILDTFSYGQSTPRKDKSQDISITSYNVNSTGYKVRFNRKLDTGDTLDQVLVKGDTYTFCVAWSGATEMEMHSAWYNFDVTFDNNIIGEAQLSSGGDILYFVHAIVLFIGWGVVADIGIIIGRFYKSINSYLWIHAICFMFVDFSTIILVLLMLIIGGSAGNVQEDGVLEFHKILSIILGILVVIQHILGIIIKHQMESRDKDNRQALFTYRVIHVILGTIMYLAAKIDIIIGFVKNEENILLILAIIWTILLIIVRIVLEIQKGMNSRIKTKIVPQKGQPLTSIQQKLVKLLQGEKTSNEIISMLPEIKWCLFNQDIYDITDYQHPGGNFILANINGKEISRYIYGAFQLESTTMKPYTHSQFAYQTLQKRYIGTIQNNNAHIQDGSQQWDLIDKKQLAPSIMQFEFSNPSFIINLRQNIQDFGQHFSLALEEVDTKVRMYTKVLCMLNPYSEFRNQYIDFCENKTQNLPNLLVQQVNTIPLIIKKYNFPDAVSAKVFDVTNAWIQGPFGRGLEIERSSKCVAFVGGTGILPFLDLLDFLLMKSYYTVQKNKQQQLQKVFPQYEQIDENFEFTILASFQNENEFIGGEWIRKLYQINKDNNLKIFNMKIRYSDNKLDSVIPIFHGRFNEQIVTSHLEDFDKNVYICGPPEMIYNLTQIISATKQDQSKVMIV